MEIRAVTKSVRISPRKMRLIAASLRGLSLMEIMATLPHLDKRGAGVFEKTLKSALANALNNANMQKDRLKIVKIEVSEGQALKRFHPSTRGRVHPYKRRSSHLRIVLGEKEEKINGTKS